MRSDLSWCPKDKNNKEVKALDFGASRVKKSSGVTGVWLDGTTAPPMKILIPSRARANTLTTPRLFHEAGITNYIVVVNDEIERDQYLSAGLVPNGQVVSDGLGRGIQLHRQWIEDHLVDQGEWFMMLDDNIREWHTVDKAYYSSDQVDTASGEQSKWGPLFSVPLFPNELMSRTIPEMIEKAYQVGARYCGFAIHDNWFYRSVKWRTEVFVCAKALMKQKTNIRWDPAIFICEDYDQTLQHLVRDGVVLVNEYVYPVATHYEAGGCGPLSERLPLKREAMTILMQKWPGVFWVKEKEQDNRDPVFVHVNLRERAQRAANDRECQYKLW